MTQRDKFIKWCSYALAFLLVAGLENLVFARFPIYGVIPIMAPLAVVMVGVFEGSTAGAAFGIAAGVFCDAMYLHTNGGMTVACTLIGLFSGITTQYAFNATLMGGYICSALALAGLDGARVLWRLLGGAPLEGLLRIALPEVLYSLILVLPVYLIFRSVYRRVGGDRLA